MNKIFKRTALIAALALSLGGCAGISDLFRGPLPPAEATALHEHLQKKEYRTWSLWPGTTEKMPSQFPHGIQQTTRVNERALSAIEGNRAELPAGALIVKEEFEAESQPETLSVMLKTEEGQWFYARYEGGKLIEYPRMDSMCNNCHVSMKKSDNLYLKAGSL